jgi:arylsulfatase A-like enzyme
VRKFYANCCPAAPANLEPQADAPEAVQLSLGGKPPLAFLTALLLVPLAAAHATDRANIVIILADDYGGGSANCLGADRKLIRTPAIDRLAAEGLRFTGANTTSSVCSPTRYSLLTGRYGWRMSLTHEVLGVFSPLHIEPGRLNIASLLNKHGYGTAAIGKWHLGYARADESPKGRVDCAAELTPGTAPRAPSATGSMNSTAASDASSKPWTASVPHRTRWSPLPATTAASASRRMSGWRRPRRSRRV